MEKPGINGESFQLKLDRNWFAKPATSKPGGFEYRVKILDTHYHQWYYRILNFLTFGRYYNVQYDLEIVDGPTPVTNVKRV